MNIFIIYDNWNNQKIFIELSNIKIVEYNDININIVIKVYKYIISSLTQ